MSRMKKHKIKTEKPVASTSFSREKEHDLAYYIHDRVELMHQVFSVLKYKELKAMAPECVRHISIDDLQELCTEELLGISSKRLCAVLDGAAPPSDTESSSRSPSPPLETISLDSISSDDEILSQSSKKKKHKHRRRESKSKKKKSKEPQEEEAEKSKASRAGLTVLELLELQARARAIRAQLQQEQSAVVTTAPTDPPRHSHSSDNEVEIKEEPPDVVEISSEDEKPDVKALEKATESQQPRQVVQQPTDGKTVTKRINDLIITVPQAKPSRKIKLNRTKATTTTATVINQESTSMLVTKTVEETKRKKKKKDKKKKVDKEGSDHDEITLQLSDSEKMDVLGLEEKNFEAASTEDSESSSDSSGEENCKKDKSNDKDKKDKEETVTSKNATDKDGGKAATISEENTQIVTINENGDNNAVVVSEEDNTQESVEKASEDAKDIETVEETTEHIPDNDEEIPKEIEISRVEDIPLVEDSQDDKTKSDVKCTSSQEDVSTALTKTAVEGAKSEGEVSDRDSSEVEAFEPPPEVVCISDEETGKKKKKKKDKKAKKEKKSKKKDFRDDSDQNFYTDKEVVKDIKDTEGEVVIGSDEDNCVTDDACVILELSDDSSCYEVEGTVLSKEPTAEEIEALSAKIDEIEREEVVTDEQIREHERMIKEKEQNEEIENVSWKDRYLDSRKVKRVLSTANILNAIRKKNKELKKKLEESKMKERDENDSDKVAKKLEEGSIEHYNTLQGSTKFVDPVQEKDVDAEKNGEEKVTKEMKKDAKQLLKMYKKLLKYNDMTKQKDTKKKKKKKSKSKNNEEATSV